jgi:hypothetical protein
LNDEPRGDDVGSRDAIDFSPLHFLEEAAHKKGDANSSRTVIIIQLRVLQLAMIGDSSLLCRL